MNYLLIIKTAGSVRIRGKTGGSRILLSTSAYFSVTSTTVSTGSGSSGLSPNEIKVYSG